jgi:hypothetical protein
MDVQTSEVGTTLLSRDAINLKNGELLSSGFPAFGSVAVSKQRLKPVMWTSVDNGHPKLVYKHCL